ncbi:MAG: hypothetical protein ACPG1C_09250 [Alphaproteobacteria bacterium]
MANVSEVDGGSSVDSDMPLFVIGEVSGAYRLNDQWTLGAEGSVRKDWFDDGCSDCFGDDEDPDYQFQGTAHALYNVNVDTRIGTFFQYADTRPQSGDSDEAYNLYMVGIEGQHFIAPDFVVFAQAGFGDKLRDGEDDGEGFVEGYAFRTGGAYFWDEHTTIEGEIEFGGSSQYIDSSDPGRHFAVGLSVSHRIMKEHPVFLTTGMGYNYSSGTDEGEQVEELQFGIGLRFLFGATNEQDRWRRGVAIGAPKTPVRGSAWTEYID